MSFWEIENFDHVTGDIDEHFYFPYAGDLAIRARNLLIDKSAEDIFIISKVIEKLIEFQSINFDHEIALKCASATDADPLSTSRFYSHYRILKMLLDEWCTAASSLARIDFGAIIPEDRNPIWHPSELFAVLVISLVSSAMLAREAQEEEWRELLNGALPFDEFGLSDSEISIEICERSWHLTCEISMGAAGALHYAEHLKIEMDKEDLEIQRRRQKAIRLNFDKYEETYETKKRVIQEWEQRVNDFPSATKAGFYFYTWISDQKLKSHEPSTITKWIRDAAREKGIKWR